MSLSSLETQQRLATLRQKVAAGEELALEESREVIRLMRGDRVRAAAVSAKARAPKDPAAPKAPRTVKAKAAAIDSDNLLDELKSL